MLTQISLNAIVSGSSYQFTLMAIDENNVSKSIKMPILLSSEEGVFITNLISKTWDYIPDAEPDVLSQAKARKIQAINNEWIALEKTGWDSGQGYYLGITPSDVALLVGVFSLAKEAAALGLELPHLISMANTPISFSTIQEMTLLLLQYGQARSNMASSFAARRKAVADATTIEELGVI
jgi:hypothetical protein